MSGNRTSKSVKNILVGFGTMLIGYVLTFVYRKCFLMVFEEQYLGATTLFSSILQILSLAELGFGAAIMYCLYKPLAENDTVKVAVIIKYFKKIYTIIAVVVLVLGFAIMPLLPYVIKDFPVLSPNVYIIYTFYILGTSLSYFATVKMILLQADQQDYITKLVSFACKTVSQILIIVFIFTFKSFYVVLILENVVVLAQNLILTLIANRKYPYLRHCMQNIEKSERIAIRKHTMAMFTHKLGGIVLTTTDSMLISAFIGIEILGRYSNYLLLITALNGIISIIFSGVTASVGEYVSEKPIEERRKLYNMFNLIGTWIAVFSTLGLFFVSKSFITIWLGEKYLLEPLILLAISASFFVENLARTNGVFISVTGVFHKTAILSIAYALLNLGFSLLLVYYLDLAGVFIGTIIARVVIFPIEVWLLHKHGFQMRTWKYWLRILAQMLVAGGAAIAIYLLSSITIPNIWGEFFYMLALVCVIPNVLFLVCFHRTEAFKLFYTMVVSKFIKRRKRGDGI